MSEPRKARVQTIYQGKNISSQINGDLEEFTYTDVASGESDRIEIKLSDREQKWMGAWMPQQGDRIESKIDFYNWYADNTHDQLNCGNLEVDDISFSGRPFLCKIGAVSTPQNSAFNAERKTKTWEYTTLQLIGEEIAQRAGITLFYDANPIDIESIEQNARTDCDFLYSLCEEYALAMKVFTNKIVIFDEERYENAEAKIIIHEKDVGSWSYNTTVAGTYTGARFTFSDPDTDEDYEVSIGDGSRIYEINVTADNLADAEKKAVAMLNNENKKCTTMSIRMKANPALYAGMCVMISGFAGLDAKYYIEKIRTSISGRGATQMNLSLRKVIKRIKQNVSVATSQNYIVQKGDTLSAIAQNYLGKAARWIEIYNLNKETIERVAKSRGMSSSDNGHWIFPGTELIIPGQG